MLVIILAVLIIVSRALARLVAAPFVLLILTLEHFFGGETK